MDTADRDRQELEAVSFLEAGMSVNVTGLRGSGRSSMIAAVVRELQERGRRVVHFSGIRALVDGPFAALALAGLEVPQGKAAAVTAAELVASLSDLLIVPGTVLAVDDADDLDQPSMGVLVAAAMRAGAALLIGTRPDGLRQSEIGSFSAQLPPGVRMRLAPLNHVDIHTLVLELLGGPVASETLSAIAIESGGIPGLISSMVRTGVISGHLVRRDGLWQTAGELWSPLLGQTLEPLLVDLDADALHGLETLAWAGVVGFDDAVALVGADALSRLDDAGLTQMLRLGGDAFVAVYPPLLAEHIRRDAPPVRRALASARADAVSGGPAADAGPLSGSDRLFNQRFREHWRGELAARTAVWELSPSPATAVPVIHAIRQLGEEGDSVDDVLRRTPGDIGAAIDRARLLAERAIHIAVVERDIDAARAALATDDPTLVTERGYLAAVAAHLGFVAGRRTDPDTLQAGEHDSAPSAFALAVARIELLIAEGRTADARALLDALGAHDPEFEVDLELAEGVLLVFEGRFAEAVAASRVLLRGARERLDGSAIETHSYVIALALTYAGRIEELSDHLGSVVSLAQPPAAERYLRRGCLVMAALDLLWRGLAQQARSIAEQTLALGSSTGPFPGMERPLGVWAILTADEPERSYAFREELWDVVAHNLDAGLLAHAVGTGVWLLERWPDPARIDTVAAAARSSQSALLQGLGAYLAVIGEDDPHRLLDVAAELEKGGLGFHAIRSRLTAAMIRRRDGDARGAFEITQHAWASMRSTGIGAPALFSPLAEQVDLTAREWQIAKLIRRGTSNGRIADELVLSVRTVENHLSNMFRKAGCDGREELASALDTWLVDVEAVKDAL